MTGEAAGSSARICVIAEAGVNHNGNPDLALELVDVAAAAGADCVKFQTFTADRLASDAAPKASYQQRTTDAGESQVAMLRRLELPRHVYPALVARCRDKKIEFLSTPFDEESADFLNTLGMARFKIPSGEVTNLPFLAHIAKFGKPIILSTGMATLAEVGIAIEAIRAEGNNGITVLHCVTDYPADPADANLRAMTTMADAFRLPIGYSDHTAGITVAVAAAALGAAVIEKHFTLNRQLPGPDHAASLEAPELTAMIEGIRTVECALGDGQKVPTANELRNRDVVRRSITAARDLAAGARLTAADVTMKRPGTGLTPALIEKIIGLRLIHNVASGTVLQWSMLDKSSKDRDA